MAQIDIETQTTASVSTPTSGNTTVFVDSTTKKLKSKDDAGTVYDYGSGGNAITQLTGDVTATGPGVVTATLTASAITSRTLTGLSPYPGVVQSTDTILQAFNKLWSRGLCGYYGTGADGVVTLGSDTTLVRDMYYDTLTVPVGVKLYTAGYRVSALNQITINGTIDRQGNPGTATTGGSALAAGTIGGSGAGGAGGTTAAGVAGTATTSTVGSAGGSGGLGSAAAGGANGTVTLPTAAVGGVECLAMARQASIGRTLDNVLSAGGSGGGGAGGSGASGQGGGGGSGGGVVVLCARIVTGSGTITAKGGDGFSGANVGTGTGGGGGGGGGAVLIVSENDTTAEALTISVAGGAGGSPFGTGVAGTAGSTGRIYRARI
jgi:hypothetical protein